MSTRIQDGSGSNHFAKVTEDNLLRTHAFTEAFEDFALFSGESYNINTGTITLTNATATPVLYIENTSEEANLVISRFLWSLRASTSGSGDSTIDVYKNITGGTIVSNATNVDMRSSKNVGSGSLPTANVYKGATGNTFTGGTQIVSTLAGASSSISITTGVPTIPPGNNICVVYTPPSSNTSQPCQFIAGLWRRDVLL